jgi:Zn-dependent peptidase ImmA (M78 family)
MTRVAVNPTLLNWAVERAGIDHEEILGRFPKFESWLAEELQPTLKQLEDFAKATHAPIGFFFLQEPPAEPLPIPDFRTIRSQTITRPSPNLLDTIYVCQERQAWFREFAQATRQEPLSFVGSLNFRSDAVTAAEQIRQKLGFDLNARRECSTWAEALRLFISQAENIGVLVMVSGIVLSNTHRVLNVDEFRGFALSDNLAPLVFINGADSTSAQMFTLAHELAHLWLGATALSNITAASFASSRAEEVWCNKVAAELLVPMSVFRTERVENEIVEAALPRLARKFKVSTLVVLRRMLDAGWLNQNAFDRAWAMEIGRIQSQSASASSGGDFIRSTAARVSRRFARALVVSTLEGQTLYRDAFRMLGFSKSETFEKFGREVGALL